MREPVQTITAGGGHFGVVTTTVVKAEPGADLKHWPEIRDLLNTYCGYNLRPEDVILFLIGGTWYFMADIGLRMLTPRNCIWPTGSQGLQDRAGLYREGVPENQAGGQVRKRCTPAIRRGPGTGKPAGVVRRGDHHHGRTGKGGGGIAARKERRKIWALSGSEWAKPLWGRTRRDENGNIMEQSAARWDANPDGGSVAIWPMDPRRWNRAGRRKCTGTGTRPGIWPEWWT